jgi:hypothetical protein
VSSPEFQAALKREAHFKFLSDVIIEWQSDPRAYDLRLVSHELQKATGGQGPGGMAPGEFIALLDRCKVRGANPAVPVPPKSALQLKEEHQERLLEKGVLLEAQPLYRLPAMFRLPWDHPWKVVEAAQSGNAASRLVVFDWPQAPVDNILFIGAEMGMVPGTDGKRLWYRAYCKVNRFPDADVQILAEGTTTTVAGARTVVKRRLTQFVREQCDAEPLLEGRPPRRGEAPQRTELYTVQVRLSRDDIDDLGGWRHQAELSAVVSKAVQKFAADRRRLRKEREAARARRQARKAATEV